MNDANDELIEDLIDEFAKTMERAIDMWIKAAKRDVRGLMFVVTDDDARLAAALHEAEPASFMMTPTKINRWRLLATTESAFTKAIEPDEPLDPHKGKGWVRIVVMNDENFIERWREMRTNAN